MPRRFKESENPQKARTDWKKEQEARQPRRAPAGGRGGLLQNMMARRMGGGPGPGGGGPGGGLDAMRNHPAVGFGRQMTGGVGDGASAAIRNMVMQRLAQKGMSQDATGTWQIAGLNRPHDPGLDIRNSAIAAMDPTGEMLRRVLGASPMPGGMRGMPSGLPGSGIPSPGLGAGSLPPGPQNGMPLPPVFPSGGPGLPGTTTTSSRPGTINGVPVPPGGMDSVPPGLPGGPPMTPGTGGTVPSPGLGGGFPTSVPKLPPVAPPSGSPPFPPQGQGVGRETTPTGAEIDPTKYPPTGNGQGPGGANIIQNPSLGLPPARSAGGLIQPAPSAPLGAPAQPRYIPTDAGGPAGQGGNGGLMSPPQPRYIPTDAGGPAGQGGNGMYPPVAALPPAGMAGGLNQAAPPPPAGNGQGPGGANIIQNPSPATSMPPPSVANDIYRQPGAPPPTNTAPGSEAPGGWGRASEPGRAMPPPPPMNLPSPPPGSTMMTFANPGSALTQRLQQGRPGTPPAPGRAPTPMVPAGAMPGQSTPFNPAQMAQQGMKLPPIPRPGQAALPGQTRMAGGHGEGTTIPQRQPANLANLGQSIQATVASRIGASQQGLRPGVSPATPGSPVGNSLDDLGERIRAAVAGNNGSVQPAAPSAGGTNLGQATTSIMDRVRQQLSQAGIGPGGQPQAPALPPMTNGTTPFPTQNTSMTPGGNMSTGTMQGGAPVPPGGSPSMMAPPATTAPGTVTGGGKIGSYGNPTIDQWDSAFIAAGTKYGVDPTLLKAMMEIESGGNGNYGATQCRGSDGYDNVPACGPMQIKWEYHASKCPSCDPNTVEGQIEMAAAILDDGVKNQGYATHRDALFGIYFPGDDSNGTTQGSYGAKVDELMATMGPYNPSAAPTTTAVDPTTGQPTGQLPPGANTPIANGGPVAGDPGAMDPPAGPATPLNPAPGGDTSLIPGMDTPINTTGRTGSTDVVSPPNAPTGNIVDTTFDPNYEVNSRHAGPYNEETRAIWSVENMSYLEALAPGLAQATYDNNYGFKSTGPSSYCEYAGWNCNLHSGLDIPAAPYTQLNSLTEGQVICAGGQSSADNPGVGCGAYGDDLHGGIGNISVLEPNGAVIVYGHMNSSNYGLDQQVAAGAPIGGSGGSVSDHLHLDVKLPVGPNSEYMLVDPNLYFNNGYCDRGYCAY